MHDASGLDSADAAVAVHVFQMGQDFENGEVVVNRL